MSDLIERLRYLARDDQDMPSVFCGKAADEIERLEARVAELEKTNRWLRSLAFISHTDHYEKPPYQWTITFKSSCTTIENALKQALKD